MGVGYEAGAEGGRSLATLVAIPGIVLAISAFDTKSVSLSDNG
jgi:hypothetical protein